jgi:NAD(P)H-nitrite reductase large subunit
MRRFVIIGSGPAGIAAAEAIRSHDSSGDILLVTDDPHGYYSRPGLAYYLTGELPENMLFPYTEQDFRSLGARRLNARVETIEHQHHRIVLHTQQQIAYDRLLLATGAFAARLDAPGNRLEGVVKLDNLDDARNILKTARKGRTAVVVGGGITALEIVEGLVAHGVKTHYFLRGDRYWSNVLDETESSIVEHRLREHGVQIHYQTELAEVIEKRGRVSSVRTKDGRQISCDLLAVAIGTRARKDVAVASGLEVNRGVLVSETMQTNAHDVFAAGDVAQVYDPRLRTSVLDTLWGPAREQGHVAGLNMSGASTVYQKPVPFNVTRLANLTTTIIGSVGHGSDPDLLGIARGDSETWRQLPDAIAAQANFDVNRLRVLVGQKTLLGAIIMGDQTLSQAVHRLIAGQADITAVREKLLHPDAPLADVLAEFYTRWKSQHDQTQQS